MKQGEGSDNTNRRAWELSAILILILSALAFLLRYGPSLFVGTPNSLPLIPAMLAADLVILSRAQSVKDAGKGSWLMTSLGLTNLGVVVGVLVDWSGEYAFYALSSVILILGLLLILFTFVRSESLS